MIGSLSERAVRHLPSHAVRVRPLRAVDHEFWPAELGHDEIDLRGVIGHRQVTDAYLAGLTRSRGGRLATLDRGMAALHADVAVLLDED